MSGISEQLSPDEQRLAELGYKQELKRGWSGFSNFAISFSIISILAGCFTTYGQAWINGGPVAISIGWPVISLLHPAGGVLDGRTGLGDAHRGRDLLLVLQARRGRLGLVHRLVQPDRPGGRDRLGRLRRRHVLELHPVVLRTALPGCQLCPRERPGRASPHVRAVRDHPGGSRSDQHLLLAPGGVVHQDLGVVARDRGAGDHRDPDRGPEPPPELRVRVRPPDQPLRFQQPHVLVLRAAARVPADHVHDHRLRRLGAHLRGDQRRRRGRAQGRVAVGVLLGRVRLGGAAGTDLRRHPREARSPPPAAPRSRSSRRR